MPLLGAGRVLLESGVLPSPHRFGPRSVLGRGNCRQGGGHSAMAPLEREGEGSSCGHPHPIRRRRFHRANSAHVVLFQGTCRDQESISGRPLDVHDLLRQDGRSYEKEQAVRAVRLAHPDAHDDGRPEDFLHDEPAAESRHRGFRVLLLGRTGLAERSVRCGARDPNGRAPPGQGVRVPRADTWVDDDRDQRDVCWPRCPEAGRRAGGGN
mmetsp:Transcript_47462/g.123142  ORF Transcript_47462/g.123142 Transcript_47462/m.123142 type:complete len:210 (+) Transcript_47462:424-1053(+)